MINELKRAAALGAATAALAAGAVVGTASAAPQDHHRPSVAPHHCVKVAGHWARQWRPAYRDRHHHWHPGHWTRIWVPAHKECRR